MRIGTSSNKIDISKEKDTKLISEKISNFLRQGDILFLYGEIGVGKTTFVKYLINYLQIKSQDKKTEVTSPTFNIINEYKIKKLKIMHCDLFRVKHEQELKNIGLFENSKEFLIFVEWPEIIKVKPKNRIELNFIYEENLNKRSLVISSDYKKEIINVFK